MVVHKAIFAILTVILIFNFACAKQLSNGKSTDIGNTIATAISKATGLTIYHINVSGGGHESYNPHEVEELATMVISLRCEYKCGNNYSAINKIFSENDYFKIRCGGPYSTLLRIHKANQIQDFYLGSAGHCLYVKGKTYMAQSSILNGVIGGLPDYSKVGVGYGVENLDLSKGSATMK